MKKFLALLASAVMLLALAIIPTTAASADVLDPCYYVAATTQTNCLADDANHGYCTPNPWPSAWGDTFVAAMWQLDQQTDMYDTYFSSGVSHVDVGGYINSSPEILNGLSSAYRGMQLCTLRIAGSSTVCDQSSIIVSSTLSDPSQRRITSPTSTQRTDRSMELKMSKLASAGTAFLLGTALLAGCTTPAESPDSPPAAQYNTSSASWERAFQGLPGFNADLELYKGNREMERLVDVIVLGTVGAVRDGALYGTFEDDFSDINSVVFELKVERVIKGEVRPGEAVYFPLMVPDGLFAADWQKAIPEGTPMVAYLENLPAPTPGEQSGIDVKGYGAGMPENAQVFNVFPQGFALQVAPGTLYWPISEVSHEGTLEDALPDGPAHGSPELAEITPDHFPGNKESTP